MEIRQGHVFSYEEALALFPTVRDRTAAAIRVLEELGFDDAASAGVAGADDDETAPWREVVARWSSEIEALGCQVKGLWLVDFDSGDGYFCWRHPEPALAHFHGYDEGFAGRVPIA